MSEDDRFEAASDELYAGPPAEFVARREALVASARANGERALAAAIKALRRPTVGAWYLNTAARAGLISLRELLGLGEGLRTAQSGGDLATLRELAARRGPLVARVLRDLTRHLADLGVTATPAGLDEVRRTLAAALADPEVAELTRRGRLDRAHDYSGFGPIGPAAASVEPLPASPTRSDAPSATPASTGQPRADQQRADRVRADQQQAAEAALQQARATLADAETRRRQAEQALQEARDRAADLARQFQVAEDAARAAEAALAEVVERQDRARLDVRQAEDTLAGLAGG